MSDSRFYITTPIYYTNGEPHLGHTYTTIACDAIARFHRLRGDDTRFLTGTDEHGIKMVKTAEAQQVEPKDLSDRMVAVFQAWWKEIDISHDDFIRTPEQRHKDTVQEIVRRLLANDDIYLGDYEGWYDEGQEEFITEATAKANNFKSAISGRPLVRQAEPTYFFRLSKYVPRLIEHIESTPDFIRPESRRNQVLSGLRAGVEDLSISRASLKWGIPMPNDPKHVIYVWIDALSNYVSALGFAREDESLYRRYWPADVHLIGKEILWFHTVYWPAMLMSLGQPLPKSVFAHGWWTADGKKMSKILGNFVDLGKLRELIKVYSLDAVRYYLLRAAPFGNDLDWTDADFQKSFNELGNVLGNCLNRIVKMTGRYREGKVPPAGPLEEIDRQLLAQSEALAGKVVDAYSRVALQDAAILPIELARATNGYIDATEPFKLAKDPAKAQRLDTVLNVSTQAIRRALVALVPILPHKAIEGLAQLNAPSAGTFDELMAAMLPAGHQLGEGQPLFPKVEAK
jgi:methionyl-tRNA synthetase